MKCIHKKSKVTTTKWLESKGFRVRYRKCLKCSKKFTTYELQKDSIKKNMQLINSFKEVFSDWAE